MLVVVVAVGRVQVLPMAVVRVTGVGGRRMAASRPMDMHVTGMRDVHRHLVDDPVVHVVAVEVMEMAVVQVVEVVVVPEGGVPAPPVMHVVMGGVRAVRWVLVGSTGLRVHARSHGGTGAPRSQARVIVADRRPRAIDGHAGRSTCYARRGDGVRHTTAPLVG